MAWLTNKETGGIFNTDWIDDKKEKQIADNQRQADRLNGKTADYSKIEKNVDKTMELYKRTGINMTGNITAGMSKSVCSQVCATLEDLQNKYHINAVTDVNSGSNERLEVSVPNAYDKAFNELDVDDAFAQARLCKIDLNSKYYSLEQNELDEIYAQSATGYRPYHPTGSTAKDIIAHEAAHHMLNTQVWNMCKNVDSADRADRYNKIHNFLMESTEYTAMGEKTLPEIKTLFNKFEKVREQYLEYVRSDDEAQGYIGAPIRDDTRLRYMANSEMFGRYGISKYAGTNYHELVAESFTDFYANGQQAKPLSRMVCFEILDIKEAKV